MVQNRKLKMQKLVLDAIHKYNCNTVQDLVTNIQIIDHSLTLEDICDAVKLLAKEKKIVLAHPQIQYSFLGYLTKSYASLPFWISVLIVAMTLVIAYLPLHIIERAVDCF